MKTLNLVYPEQSDIKYRIDKFPDGQQQVTITSVISVYSETITYITYPNWEIPKEVTIKSRLNNFTDLELIICAVKSLRNLGVKEIHLYTPYFLGSRSDRQFEIGSNNYLKDVICPIINSLNFESVTVLDPHSHVLEACLNNFRKVDNKRLVEFALREIHENSDEAKPWKDQFILVSPDAGASHKIYKLAEQIGYKGDIITCSKERNTEGKVTKTVVPIDKFNGKDLIIIDDICDGGATFINIAKELRNKLNDYTKFNTEPKIYLIVTHGIFSKGFNELSKYFDGIYCTNSYKDIQPLDLHNFKPFLKQLNVF